MSDYQQYLDSLDYDEQIVVDLALVPDANLSKVAAGLAPLVILVNADDRKVGMSVTLGSSGGVTVCLSGFDSDGGELPFSTSTLNCTLLATV